MEAHQLKKFRWISYQKVYVDTDNCYQVPCVGFDKCIFVVVVDKCWRFHKRGPNGTYMDCWMLTYASLTVSSCHCIWLNHGNNHAANRHGYPWHTSVVTCSPSKLKDTWGGVASKWWRVHFVSRGGGQPFEAMLNGSAGHETRNTYSITVIMIIQF